MHIKPSEKKRKKRTRTFRRQQKKRRTSSLSVSASNTQVSNLNKDQVARKTNTESLNINVWKQAPQNDVVTIVDRINLPVVRDYYPTGFTSNDHNLITDFTNYYGLQHASSSRDRHCCPYSVALSYVNRYHSFNDS